MGFSSCLTLLLVAAKLFGYTHYSWLVAFSPTLVAFGLIAFVTLASAVLGIAASRRN